MRGRIRAMSPGRAVEVVELAVDRRRLVVEFFGRSAGGFGVTTGELDVALFCGLGEDVLPLLGGDRVSQPVAVGAAHVVHAHRGHGFDARIDLGGTDDEAPAAADPERADPFGVDEGLGAQVIHRGAEVLGIDVGGHQVARLAVALTPERQVQGHGDEALFGQLGGVQVGALLLDRTHRMSDDHRRVLGVAVQVVGDEQVSGRRSSGTGS